MRRQPLAFGPQLVTHGLDVLLEDRPAEFEGQADGGIAADGQLRGDFIEEFNPRIGDPEGQVAELGLEQAW